MTWGSPHRGSDCSAVQDQLMNVQQIQATGGAFAAILADGSVVAWGHPNLGGDCSAVQEQLKNVQQIQASCYSSQDLIHDLDRGLACDVSPELPTSVGYSLLRY